MTTTTKKRKVTLFYRAESKAGNVTITTDENHAQRSGDITRIYRSKKQAIPALTICTVPKGTAPWEISSELEVAQFADGKVATFQVNQLGELGRVLLRWYGDGELWNDEIIIVPEKMIPPREKSFKDDKDKEKEGDPA